MQREGALFCIHAPIVQAIIADRAWEGEPPFDVADSLGISRSREELSLPVLLLGQGPRAAAIRAIGAVTLKQIDVRHVWPVPNLVRSPSRPQAVSAVAFASEEFPLIVLDPFALLALAAEHAGT
jgi:hypothetical protein